MPSPHWEVMNNLSETITSFLFIRDILRDSKGDSKIVEAATTLLEHYIDVQDRVFNEAWNEVVNNNSGAIFDTKHLQYTDEELNAMCDKAEKDQAFQFTIKSDPAYQQSKEQIYKNYRAAIDEYNKLNSKYKELQMVHEELQNLFYKVDGELDELKVQYNRSREDYHKLVSEFKQSLT